MPTTPPSAAASESPPADLDGDGRADLITAAGPGGGPHVRGWSGVDLTDLTGFFAFDPAFTGGVSVAAGAAATSGAALPLASPATAARPADMVPRDQWERIRVAVLQRWEAAGLSADEDADSAVVDLPIAAALALEIKTKLVPRQHSE